jgi:arginine-tRNA-protein transferase
MIDRCPWPALPPPRNIPLTTLAEHPCPYLPGRVARNRAFVCEGMPPALYHELMDAAFRRSGTFVYQPVCSGCRECRPIRVPVDRFTPSKSQRRAWRRNADLVVEVTSPPQPSEEKFNLYILYLRGRHDSQREDDFAGFVEFLYRSPVDTIEITYRLADAARTLVGVGICDLCAARSLSSVYFFFDPAHARRGLGTFSSLWEIDFARRRNIPYYYLGYWVRDCESMSYKAQLRPSEVLDPDGVWRATTF